MFCLCKAWLIWKNNVPLKIRHSASWLTFFINPGWCIVSLNVASSAISVKINIYLIQFECKSGSLHYKSLLQAKWDFDSWKLNQMISTVLEEDSNWFHWRTTTCCCPLSRQLYLTRPNCSSPQPSKRYVLIQWLCSSRSCRYVIQWSSLCQNSTSGHQNHRQTL